MRNFNPKQLEEVSLAELEERLVECLVWCRRLLASPQVDDDWSNALRSKELALPASIVFPDSCRTPPGSEVSAAFDDFLKTRSSLVARSNLFDPTARQSRDESRRDRSLLLMNWSGSLYDGAVEPETNGFLDLDGMPPWDSWLMLVYPSPSHSMCLLSWVPSWASEDVGRSITIDAAECYSWVLPTRSKLILNGWGKD